MRVYICNCPGCDGRTCEAMDYCMCGSEMSAHGLGSGHSAVSMHDYYSIVSYALDWGPFMEAMAYCASICSAGLITAGLLDYFKTAEYLAWGTLGFMALCAGGAINQIRDWREL